MIIQGFWYKYELQYNISSQTDGETKRVNQLIKDILRMDVMDNPLKWEDYYMHLVEFVYNNGYQY
jgi:hypothetical protein